MRVYGRTTDILTRAKYWRVVETAPDGSNDYVYLTALAQVYKLNLNESPFYANYGIPARESVQQQVAPDYYVYYIQQKYSKFFANLLVDKVANYPPTYNISVLTHMGVRIPPLVLTFGVPI